MNTIKTISNSTKSLVGTTQRLIIYALRHWPQLAISFAATILYGIISAAPSYLIKYTIDSVIVAKAVHLLIPSVIVFILSYAIKGVFMYYSTYYMGWVSNKVIADIRVDLFSRVIHFPLSFYKRVKTGVLMTHFLSDVELIQHATARSMRNGIRSIFEAAALIAVAFVQSPMLTAIMFIVAPMLVMTTKFMGDKMRTATVAAQIQMGKLSGLLQEMLLGIREIKAYNNEETEIARFEGQVANYFAASKKNVQTHGITPALTELIAMTGVGIIFFIAVRQVISGTMTPGQLGSFFSALLMAYQPLKRIINAYTEIQTGIAAATRIFEVMDAEDIGQSQLITKCPTLKNAITIDNLSFAYEPTSYVLKNLSLTIQKGERIGIIGVSGSGKSTLCDLLMGFITPTAGSIIFDDMDITDFSPRSLRDHMSYVSQRPFLFNDTIAANVAYGRLDASRDEIEVACRAAQAHNFIAQLPQGYDTIVGEDGGTLSGGERQRLTIARALLKDPDLFIFDEATSALDSYSEKKVAQAINNIGRDKTIIIITHRPQLLNVVDRVLSIQNGQLISTVPSEFEQSYELS